MGRSSADEQLIELLVAIRITVWKEGLFIFRIRHYWEIRKVVSTDCAARRCSVGHALSP